MIVKYNNKERYDGYVSYGKDYIVLGLFQFETDIRFAVMSDNKESIVLIDSHEIDVIDKFIPFDWTVTSYKKGFLISARNFTPEFWDKLFIDDNSVLNALQNEIVNINLFHGIDNS